jgi:hypothetical protein
VVCQTRFQGSWRRIPRRRVSGELHSVFLKSGGIECDLPAALQDYCSPKPLLYESKFRYQLRVSEQFPESLSSRFFRPLLYRLSYLGGASFYWRFAALERREIAPWFRQPCDARGAMVYATEHDRL